MQGNNNQVLTQDEKYLLRRCYVRLVICEVCGAQIFNDGHRVEVPNMDQSDYVLCDDCYDSWVRSLNS